MSEFFELTMPVIIEAIQVKPDNEEELLKFGNGEFTVLANCGSVDRVLFSNPLGYMTCMLGDYILKGPDGIFYPSKRELFEQFYKKVDTAVGSQLQ